MMCGKMIRELLGFNPNSIFLPHHFAPIILPDRLRHSSFVILCLTLLAAGPTFAATAVTVEGQSLPCEVVSIDATPTATLRVDGAAKPMACTDLQAIELRPGEPSVDIQQSAILLRDGSCLRGSIQDGSGSSVKVASPLFGEVECPLQAVARIELPGSQSGPPLQPGEKLDRLLLRNGETIEGSVEWIGPKGIRFRSEPLGQIEIAFERLLAVAFAGQGPAPKGVRPIHLFTKAPPEGAFAIVHADNGTLVAGRIASLAGGKLTLKALFGQEMALDAARLLRIEFRGGRLIYLSDLEPAEAKETPFFDLVWHYRRDQSIDGNPLRLGGRTYRKGLGVHSRCELTYELKGSFRRFLADFGIDGEVGEKGDVDVAVLVDGVPRFERKSVTGRDGPVPVALDVAGAARLTLRVDFGRDLDICDHADWANARLIR